MSKLRKIVQGAVTVSKLAAAHAAVYVFKRSLLDQNIWIIEEKRTEARDNGYHLFKYMRKNHPEENVYYVITKDAADYSKVSGLGKVIWANSFKHCMLYIAAKYNIGSQPTGAAPTPAYWVFRLKRICRPDQKRIFLQHGIIKDDLPSLYYDRTGFDLFVTSAKREYDYVLKKFGYTEKNLKLLGLCRFDNLLNRQTQKYVLVMPTFRKYLVTKDCEHAATPKESEAFKKSIFWQGFSELLNDARLKDALRNMGYTLIFYMHYSLQSYTDCFQQFADDTVIIADRKHYDVQQLMIESAVMVTDFSSVFFDFAYMMKPEIMFQPDQAEFRQKHYKEGYFDYQLDGFGPVFTEVAPTVDYIIGRLKDNCQMERMYKDRANAFFTLHDTSNCERNYKAIKELK